MSGVTFILLASAKHDQEATRSFREFSVKEDLAQTIIGHFEDWLNEKERIEMEKRGLEVAIDDCLEYTTDQLYNFMDEFYGELVCLEKENGFADMWRPMTIDWIKETIQIYLRNQYSTKIEHCNGLINGMANSGMQQMEISSE